MGKIDRLEVEVAFRIPDETVATCLAVLNTWMKQSGNRVVVREMEDGTCYMEVV